MSTASISQRAQQINFNKEAYDPKEWEAIEEWFTDAVQAIAIPPQPDTADVMRLNSQIDYVASRGGPLAARMKRKYESMEQQRKLAEETAFLAVQQSEPPKDNEGKPIKLTVDLTKAIRTEYLINNPLNFAGTDTAMPANIYLMERASQDRFTFMEAVMKELKRKQDALITDTALLKMETKLTPDGNASVA